MAAAIPTIIGTALPYIISFPNFSDQLAFVGVELDDKNRQNIR
jgi:hypothetical protein